MKSQEQFLNGELIYFPNFIENSVEILNYLLKLNGNESWEKKDWRKLEKEYFPEGEFQNIQWKQQQIKMFGKLIYEPRFVAWYGDQNANYHYSGINLTPNAWTKELMALKVKIEKQCKHNFNSVLLNWYRDGEDYMGWHSDDEKELGKKPVIASVSLGAVRKFQLRKKQNKKEKVELLLENGSLLMMKGNLQHNWQHCLPKQKLVKDPRINLTFREIALN